MAFFNLVLSYGQSCSCVGCESRKCCVFYELVKEGGYDQKVNETVSMVASKTSEIGQKTWGIMKGVMAMASQKVEEFTKEGGVNWKSDSWSSNVSGTSREGNGGYDQRFTQENDATRYPGGHSADHPSMSSDSWDDWSKNEPAKMDSRRVKSGTSWAGWDDAKDENSNFYSGSTKNNPGVNSKSSGSTWTGGGFQ